VEANIFHPNSRISFHYISIVPIEKSIKPFDFHEKMDRLGYKKPFVFFQKNQIRYYGKIGFARFLH
jgi:hypothetical protein